MRMLLICFSIVVLAAAGILLYACYPEPVMPAGVVVDSIDVSKSDHRLTAYAHQQPVRTYPIAIGKNPIGAKEYEGDLKTPEGHYHIYDKNPNSRYHKNLGVSYPNAADAAHAKILGKPPGGDIKIHGMAKKQFYIGRWHRFADWTNGCIALTNEEVDELYEHTPVGTPINIRP